MRNYVIADIEWIDYGGFVNPTQISAINVNCNWDIKSHFSKKIKPRSKHFYNWKHTAYNGGTADDFLSARSAFNVLEEFGSWLDENDVILWWSSAEKGCYCSLVKSIHKRECTHKQLVLRDYLNDFLYGKEYNRQSLYETAAALNLFRKGKEHNSLVDVATIKDILKAVNFSRKDLEYEPVDIVGSTEQSARSAQEYAVKTPFLNYMPFVGYVYDKQVNVVHAANSGCAYPKFAPYTSELAKFIKKKIPPCHVCLQVEYNEKKKQMYLDTVSRMHCKFIYTPRSKIFHKLSCKLLHYSLTVLGCQKYDTAIKSGRRPCKICNPTVDDEQKKKTKKIKTQDFQIKIEENVVAPEKKKPRQVEKAIKRLQQAKEERSAIDFDLINGEEKYDALTLTGTFYGFFAGKGYKNFHLKSCPRLKQLNGIMGFRIYNEAISAGFTPCKTCRPSQRYNVDYSIPINNEERPDETLQDLYDYCAKFGYPCTHDDEYFDVQTPVGKWRIDLTSKPVRLKHINLVIGGGTEEYHDQPRLFLSLTDAILYIRKHDNNILR